MNRFGQGQQRVLSLPTRTSTRAWNRAGLRPRGKPLARFLDQGAQKFGDLRIQGRAGCAALPAFIVRKTATLPTEPKSQPGFTKLDSDEHAAVALRTPQSVMIIHALEFIMQPLMPS